MSLKFVIKKQLLDESQINLIRMYKTFLVPINSYVEEYTAGFKFYIDPNTNVENIVLFFKGFGIYVIYADFFDEIWEY